jgi:hypothetical protein
MAGGRPSLYTPEIGDKICEGIAQRVPLVRICASDDAMPEPRTVYKWLREHPEFVQNYTRAREDQADFIADELVEITDNSELEANDKRIRVDARKWLASKYRPKVYGDKIMTEHSGTIGTTDLSDEELTRRLAELEQAKAQSER